MNKKIVTIKSKEEVIIDTFKNVKATPMCEILTFTQYEDGFDANGRYFYLTTKEVEKEVEGETVTEEVTNRTEISSFNRTLTNAEADGLFNALALEFPEDATYSEKRKIEVTAGLMYLVNAEGYWGLTSNDWEVIIEDENE